MGWPKLACKRFLNMLLHKAALVPLDKKTLSLKIKEIWACLEVAPFLQLYVEIAKIAHLTEFKYVWCWQNLDEQREYQKRSSMQLFESKSAYPTNCKYTQSCNTCHHGDQPMRHHRQTLRQSLKHQQCVVRFPRKGMSEKSIVFKESRGCTGPCQTAWTWCHVVCCGHCNSIACCRNPRCCSFSQYNSQSSDHNTHGSVSHAWNKRHFRTSAQLFFTGMANYLQTSLEVNNW